MLMQLNLCRRAEPTEYDGLVSSAEVAQQLRALAKHRYSAVSLDDVCSALLRRQPEDERKRVCEKLCAEMETYWVAVSWLHTAAARFQRATNFRFSPDVLVTLLLATAARDLDDRNETVREMNDWEKRRRPRTAEPPPPGPSIGSSTPTMLLVLAKMRDLAHSVEASVTAVAAGGAERFRGLHTLKALGYDEATVADVWRAIEELAVADDVVEGLEFVNLEEVAGLIERSAARFHDVPLGRVVRLVLEGHHQHVLAREGGLCVDLRVEDRLVLGELVMLHKAASVQVDEFEAAWEEWTGLVVRFVQDRAHFRAVLEVALGDRIDAVVLRGVAADEGAMLRACLNLAQ